MAEISNIYIQKMLLEHIQMLTPGNKTRHYQANIRICFFYLCVLDFSLREMMMIESESNEMFLCHSEQFNLGDIQTS